RVERVAEGVWRERLTTLREGAAGERAVESNSCKSLADATAFIIALAIDPQRVSSAPPPALTPTPTPTRAPTPAPPPPPPPPPPAPAPPRPPPRPRPPPGPPPPLPLHRVRRHLRQSRPPPSRRLRHPPRQRPPVPPRALRSLRGFLAAPTRAGHNGSGHRRR